jgi:hypothetical protein
VRERELICFISIRGAMLDIIKKEVRFEENVMQTEEDVLEYLNDVDSPETVGSTFTSIQSIK